MGDRRFLGVLGVAILAIVGLSVVRGLSAPPPAARSEATATPPTVDPAAFLVAEPAPAPAINLIDATRKPFELGSLRGEAVLVFFGYTHCPDVCPVTMGILSQVVDMVGPALRVVFVTVDPDRDTPEFLADYLRYLPPGVEGLTGDPGEIRVAADAWGVRYARVEGPTPDSYSMTHTSTVFLVDPAGLLRAQFPFGTQPSAMVDAVRDVLASPLATPAPTPAPPVALATHAPPAVPTPASSPAAVADLRLEVVSTAVWSGGASPVILSLSSRGTPVTDPTAVVRVSVVSTSGTVIGTPTDAVAVQPFGVAEVSYVAPVDIPTPGWWSIRAEVAAAREAGIVGATADARVAVRDPGSTAMLGAAAPAVRTPTLVDAAGDIRRISTDPLPMERLYQTSTTDALAAGEPFVLVLDSSRWKTTDICGTALVLVRYLAERWPDGRFIHLEPFAYDVVTDSLVLRGSLSQPEVVPAAEAWGIATPPWVATSMPWVFVVDGNGIVRAKYQGVVGSADLDVLIAMLREGR